MANLGSLGGVNAKISAQRQQIEQQVTIKGKHSSIKQAKISPARINADVKRKEEAKLNRDSSTNNGKAIEDVKEQLKPMSLEELAELLRKVNLTFDLFEIQTRYTVDLNTGDVSVQVVNQRTGEVIRKIPPYEVSRMAEALKNGDPLMTNLKA